MLFVLFKIVRLLLRGMLTASRKLLDFKIRFTCSPRYVHCYLNQIGPKCPFQLDGLSIVYFIRAGHIYENKLFFTFT